jgi:hypothetical protein
MLKKALLVAAAGAVAGWYYLIDGSKIDARMVRDFYRLQQHNTYLRDPERLCQQIGGKARIRISSVVAGKPQVEDLDKKQACERLRKTYQAFTEMGEKAGGMLTIEYDYQITQLEVASNRKSATVEVTTLLKMGEEFMHISTTSSDRLERSMREVKLVASDSKVRMRWVPKALLNPEKYFQSYSQ